MVVTSLLAASETRLTHDRTASPFRWTVQAPHRAMPHPYLVPVRPNVSRSTQSSGVAGSTSTLNCLPLTLRVITTRLLMSWLDQGVTCRMYLHSGEYYTQTTFRIQVGFLNCALADMVNPT